MHGPVNPGFLTLAYAYGSPHQQWEIINNSMVISAASTAGFGVSVASGCGNVAPWASGPRPWLDTSVPASSEFLGVAGEDVTFGSGLTSENPCAAPSRREVVYTVRLFATSSRGLEYGLGWLHKQIGCAPCCQKAHALIASGCEQRRITRWENKSVEVAEVDGAGLCPVAEVRIVAEADPWIWNTNIEEYSSWNMPNDGTEVCLWHMNHIACCTTVFDPCATSPISSVAYKGNTAVCSCPPIKVRRVCRQFTLPPGEIAGIVVGAGNMPADVPWIRVHVYQNAGGGKTPLSHPNDYKCLRIASWGFSGLARTHPTLIPNAHQFNPSWGVPYQTTAVDPDKYGILATVESILPNGVRPMWPISQCDFTPGSGNSFWVCVDTPGAYGTTPAAQLQVSLGIIRARMI